MHQLHSLRGASPDVKLAHISADNHASSRDNHQIAILFSDNARGGDGTVLPGDAGSDDASSTTTMQGIVFDRGALTVAMLSDNQQFAFLRGQVERNDSITFAQANTTHATTHTRGRTQLCHGEAISFAQGGNHEHIIIRVGQLRADQLIVVFEVHSDQTLAAHNLKFIHRGFLDLALFGGDDHVIAADSFGNIDNSGDALALLDGDQVNDMFALGRAAHVW